jgi:hypothetical protein
MFPDQGQSWLIHIPKTGGTSLETRVRLGTASLAVWNPAWLSPQVGDTQRVLRQSDTVARLLGGARLLTTGHVPLFKRIDGRQIAPQDVTIIPVRDPRERLVSELNYMVKRVSRAPESPENQSVRDQFELVSRTWRDHLLDPDFVLRVCASEEFVGGMSNLMCRYLSGVPDADAAWQQLRIARAKLVAFDSHDKALRTLGLSVDEVRDAPDDKNESMRVVPVWADLSRSQRSLLGRVDLQADLSLWRQMQLLGIEHDLVEVTG